MPSRPCDRSGDIVAGRWKISAGSGTPGRNWAFRLGGSSGKWGFERFTSEVGMGNGITGNPLTIGLNSLIGFPVGPFDGTCLELRRRVVAKETHQSRGEFEYDVCVRRLFRLFHQGRLQRRVTR